MSERITRQIMLLSLVVLIIPMLLFPERLGIGLAKASIMYMMYELVFYGFVLFLINRRTTLIQLVQACVICLIYRVATGAAFGLLIAFAYSMNLKVSIALGVVSYLPAIVLHIVATPFILWPAIKQIYAPQKRSYSPPQVDSDVVNSATGRTTFAVSTTQPASAMPINEEIEKNTTPPPDSTQASPTNYDDGFSQATRYIGQNSSVLVAAVVDDEGLLLGHFQRGSWVAEDLAPLALQLGSVNHSVLDKAGWTQLERISISDQKNRIIIAGDHSYRLLVVAEKTADDILNIRINQGNEIIRKYITQRFSTNSPELLEKAYVRSTQ